MGSCISICDCFCEESDDVNYVEYVVCEKTILKKENNPHYDSCVY